MKIRRYNREYVKIRRINNGVIRMAVLTSRKPVSFAIKREKWNEFIEESNKNTISEEFLKECREVSKLFKKR